MIQAQLAGTPQVYALGGFDAQQAVFFATEVLLYDYRSYRKTGEQWSDACGALNAAWDNCGRWQQ